MKINVNNINMEEAIKNIGALKALEDVLHEITEVIKTEIKKQKLNITNDTAVISVNGQNTKVYTEENQKKIDKLKKRCAEAIASIPYENNYIDNYSVKITPFTQEFDNAMMILKTLLNQDAKKEAIKIIQEVLR